MICFLVYMGDPSISKKKYWKKTQQAMDLRTKQEKECGLPEIGDKNWIMVRPNQGYRH